MLRSLLKAPSDAPLVKPRSVVLSLVRVAQQRPWQIGELLTIGELFGIKPSTMRVAVARLLADGKLKSDARGSYRLGHSAAVVHRHVEDWRRGEARMRPWKGAWLCAMLPSGPTRTRRRNSLRALSRFGFREGLSGLWVRPDNLRQSLADTKDRMCALGLEDHAELFRASDWSPALLARFMTSLWPVQRLARGYSQALRNLERSLPQLHKMPLRTALLESFVLGGEAIRVLATDPLLPEQIMKSQARAKLTEVMLRYDAAGQALWFGLIKN